MEKEWHEYLKQQFILEDKDLRTYSPLTLAYIGDGIYELLVRTVLISRGNAPVAKLHRKASAVVKAGAQAAVIEFLVEQELLTEEEYTIYKRGRNAYSPTRAKNASMSEYRKATGFEALAGYLYLKGDMQRLIDLVKMGLEGTGRYI
ncbi:MAG: ribonuclease III [Lachnospiraceae bacterium]|nr:ribonuclease III [Lachnospiraceae bacterium]